MGIAGIGKSDITNFLHSDPYGYKTHYFGEEEQRFLFPVVDGNTWDQTPVGLWKLMLAALTDVARHLDQPAADDKVIQLSEEQKAFSQLKGQVDWCCQRRDQSIMFILDDFDKVLTVGTAGHVGAVERAAQWRQRGKLSYLLFTRSCLTCWASSTRSREHPNSMISLAITSTPWGCTIMKMCARCSCISTSWPANR
ncbi:MAG: hypothetical protein R3E79_36635 [Caldilineaceae bacterium]